jgi:MFS family permease
LSVSLYGVTRDLASFYGLALMFGFSYGAVMPLYAILVREYFGARIIGSMFGAVNMASTLGMAIGPWTGGFTTLTAAISDSISARSASASEPSPSPSPPSAARTYCTATEPNPA